MEVKRKNRKEDLKLLVSLGSDYDGESFSLKFTSGNYGVTSYTCSYDGTTYTNCEKVDDTHVLCLLDNHNLPYGLVYVEITICMPDTQMADGNYKLNSRELLEFIVDSKACHLELTNGASDLVETAEITFELLSPVLKGEKGDKGDPGIGTIDTEMSDESENAVQNKVIKAYVDSHSADLQKSVTWADLKALRDSGELVVGQQYRITDYQCTTTTSGTRSANHQFDIIVTATDTNELNEVAKAVLHEGDTYFSACELNAWELKYCIDNDVTRFAWVNDSAGKGVVYYMKDEFGNECPYDFKNIQFYRSYDSSSSMFSTINYSATGVACYTFSEALLSTSTSTTDNSLKKSNEVFLNTVGQYIKSDVAYLNNNCFFGQAWSNSLDYNCYENTFGNGNCHTTLGKNCYKNRLGKGCYYNVFNTSCGENLLISSDHNYFGISCYHNSMAFCDNNEFGNYCTYISLGSYSLGNSFGHSARYITLSDYCSDNVFNSNTAYISLGRSYTCYSVFEANTMYLFLSSDESTSSSQKIQYLEIQASMSGTSSEYTAIAIPSDEINSANKIVYA